MAPLGEPGEQTTLEDSQESPAMEEVALEEVEEEAGAEWPDPAMEEPPTRAPVLVEET